MRCAVKPLQGGPRGERSIRDRERVREAVERPPRASPTSSARCGTAIAAIAATVTRPSASTFIDTRATVPRSSHKPIGPRPTVRSPASSPGSPWRSARRGSVATPCELDIERGGRATTTAAPAVECSRRGPKSGATSSAAIRAAPCPGRCGDARVGRTRRLPAIELSEKCGSPRSDTRSSRAASLATRRRADAALSLRSGVAALCAARG
jgi:hypothetical protein